jgi:hypothetical protein
LVATSHFLNLCFEDNDMPKMPMTIVEWIVLGIICVISLLTLAALGFTGYYCVTSPAAQNFLGY